MVKGLLFVSAGDLSPGERGGEKPAFLSRVSGGTCGTLDGKQR
ncbi:MAG: hypothetical protein BLITH_1510 [Brockia lithotrophica]|uniref:Uncharacterized protein n=1 Tax=Brockia lithotrophica TaxID=933949 RepID=A0A2T5G5I7_9BACL|nr:MAG: hypothetical protein BLITH_1510 [Brockia lithotrophica]